MRQGRGDASLFYMLSISDNNTRKRAEQLSLEELEAKMEGFQRVCNVSMLTEQWRRREETLHKWRIYYRVYKEKGGTRE